MASYVWINESLCELALGSEIIMERIGTKNHKYLN